MTAANEIRDVHWEKKNKKPMSNVAHKIDKDRTVALPVMEGHGEDSKRNPASGVLPS